MDIKDQITRDLHRIINEYFENERVPGLAVGVIHNNEVIYSKGFGVKNIDTGEPVDENSLFHMASVAKLFVGTAIMQLVERGKIDLDSYLVDYLPYFEMKDRRYKKITIRQLLNHMSGMPDEEDYQWHKPEYDEDALERYVRSNKDKELLWEPGNKFAYSNISYEILGDIIAKVSGVSFEEYMKENILDVLEMKESNFFKPAVSEELLTSPHILDIENSYGAKLSDVFPYNRAHGPSSTLYSNIVDMCNFAAASINKGRFKEAKILESHSYPEIWKEYASTDWGGYREKVGLAWFLGEYKGNKVMSHTGMDTGFRSNFIVMPEKGTAVIVMANSDHIGLNIICRSILDIVLGDKVDYVKKSLAHHMARILFDYNIEAALKEYYIIKEKSNEKYLILEGAFKFIAYELLKRKRVKGAIEMLKMSIEVFPESSKLYDSLGEMYLIDGNKELALENYKRSVHLDPNNISGQKMIDKLISENA